MNGSIRERILNKGIDKNGKTKNNLKVYDVFYRYRDPATGKVKQTSKKGFRGKGEAEDFLLRINTQLMDNNFIQIKKLTLREYLTDWLSTYVETNLRKSTIAGYRRNLEQHVLPHLGNVELQSLTSSQIDNFYAKKQKDGRLDGKGGLSAKSMIYIHRVLNEALEHAVKKRLITRNVAKDIISLPRIKKHKGEIYSANEIKALLEFVKDTNMEVPIILAAICGMRRGEILGLMWDEVSFENQTIRICRQLLPTKNGLEFEEPKSEDSNRTINTPAEVMDMLKRQSERQQEYKRLLGDEYHDNGLVNCCNNGELLNPSYFSKQFAQTIKNAGLKHIRFHDLRHSCASLMLTAGVPMKVASQILGHSSIGITADLYTHVITDLKKDAAAKVGSEIFGQTKEKEEK
jgi:integrase